MVNVSNFWLYYISNSVFNIRLNCGSIFGKEYLKILYLLKGIYKSEFEKLFPI